MPKPIKTLRAPEPVAPVEMGQWLVLIGDVGETSADIEAFFAEVWPDVGPGNRSCTDGPTNSPAEAFGRLEELQVGGSSLPDAHRSQRTAMPIRTTSGTSARTIKNAT
jgi:hypothetical protein